MAGSRAHIRNLFVRLLGVVFLIAFLSLLPQITLLVGARGLLPADAYLNAIRALGGPLRFPTVFWAGCSDTALRGAAVLGAVLSFGLILNVAPRYCLIALWALYLSFVTVGQTFFAFQWDNLLLESAFFALFVTPGGLRPRSAPAPHPIAVFLLLWLVFRLHFESGLAKLLGGDPTWRNLTAMVTYYETAPLPTWLGWYAQQLPLWAQKASVLFTFFVELLLPLCLWGPRRLRAAVFGFMIAMQLSIIATANYGFFNYLSIVLCLFVLDDGHLAWVASRFGRNLSAVAPRVIERPRLIVAAAGAAGLVAVSLVPFFPFLPVPAALRREVMPVRRVLDDYRSINAYHLFVQMTLVRREAVIEGSADGVTWQPYEFRYKPGDPQRAPAFVAPYQPRLDFQLWFLLLGGPIRAPYFDHLLEDLLQRPAAVAPFFARDPFPREPPRFLRVAVYRYRFTDPATRRATGAWWQRDLLGYSQVVSRRSLNPGGG